MPAGKHKPGKMMFRIWLTKEEHAQLQLVAELDGVSNRAEAFRRMLRDRLHTLQQTTKTGAST